MKTIATIIFATVTTISLNANAAPVHGDPGIGDVFPIQDITIQPGEIKMVRNSGKEVWSVTYEEWVNPADFNSDARQTIASALNQLENNPPAAGKYSQTFIWDNTAGEYQLQ